MTLPSFKPIQSPDSILMRLQSSLKEMFNFLMNQPAVNKQLIEDITITIGTNIIYHSLEQKVTGYYIVKANCDVRIYTTSSTKSTITIESTANSIISLIVF